MLEGDIAETLVSLPISVIFRALIGACEETELEIQSRGCVILRPFTVSRVKLTRPHLEQVTMFTPPKRPIRLSDLKIKRHDTLFVCHERLKTFTSSAMKKKKTRYHVITSKVLPRSEQYSVDRLFLGSVVKPTYAYHYASRDNHSREKLARVRRKSVAVSVSSLHCRQAKHSW